MSLKYKLLMNFTTVDLSNEISPEDLILGELLTR